MPQADQAAKLRRSVRPERDLPAGTRFGLLAAVVAVIAIAAITHSTLNTRGEAVEQVVQTFRTQAAVADIFSRLTGAESEQRGFLLTGNENYLESLDSAQTAIAGDLELVRARVVPDSEQARRFDLTEELAREKLAEMRSTLELKRAGDDQAALEVVRSNRGKVLMDRLDVVAKEILQEEQAVLARSQTDRQRAVDLSSNVTWAGSALLLTLIGIAAFTLSRQHRAREEQAWLRGAKTSFATRILGEQRLESLGRLTLDFLVEYLDARVGAVYVSNEQGQFELLSGHALSDTRTARTLKRGQGVVGQAILADRPVKIADVPAGYLPITSGVGSSDPVRILVIPASANGEVYAAVELGFFREIAEIDEELASSISEALAFAVRSLGDRKRLVGLLEETQRQAEELQAQQEELRVSNEELEEHSRALKESQARLEVQQTELEQNNSQLEEQTQVLEIQKEELSQAKAVLTDRAQELQRANQYKGEFLANMSHELRTPLNSALILAKLLADNSGGNLTAEQIEYAQTIHSAGNDLLVLINDILDLSRIESGTVTAENEEVSIESILDGLMRVHEPIARHKGLKLSMRADPGAPQSIRSDGRRLSQILRNLLSNALKFTEKGEVALVVRPTQDGRIAFAVRDSGIGIASEQSDVIFEAFRQADGGTHRKYGGTGLGLTISRDLARILGGEIQVSSVLGQGSEFTLTLPLANETTPVARKEPARRNPQRPAPREPGWNYIPRPGDTVDVTRADGDIGPATVADDRAKTGPDSRAILVVEDDTRFANILRDVAREKGFLCVVTQTAADGLRAATKFTPSAILLDINLPDLSGLGVLDQLKRNPKTRHIPVHVISVADYAQETLELGAVGHALKPVAREQLFEVFSRLEQKMSQGTRRVLIVEDDERQRDSMQLLLRGDGIELTAVETASAALERLKTTTYDCMVMDLNLPDLSGYELLDRMVEQDGVSFPPVIVYTGRALKRDEEQRLRRFARSIIVKDARSPERLLDEVSLFLHQVEAAMPADRQQMLRVARDRESELEGRRVLVVEDDVRNIFALSRVLEPKGIQVYIARNGIEAIEALSRTQGKPDSAIDLVLMDIMMPEMDGYTAMREIRKRPEWAKLPIIALTAKAMPNDQEQCLAAGANDYIAKPLDVDKLLSLVRVWMPK